MKSSRSFFPEFFGIFWRPGCRPCPPQRATGPYRPWGGRQGPVARWGGDRPPLFFFSRDSLQIWRKKITFEPCRPHRATGVYFWNFPKPTYIFEILFFFKYKKRKNRWAEMFFSKEQLGRHATPERLIARISLSEWRICTAGQQDTRSGPSLSFSRFRKRAEPVTSLAICHEGNDAFYILQSFTFTYSTS